MTPYTSLQGALSVACGRISYTFGFVGPCISIDTACSSSLVCIHVASRSIASGDCTTWMAGGVNATLYPYAYILFQVSGMLAADGRCKTLDKTADGYVRGETCGVFALKTDHEDDAHDMLVVLCASSVNQDGRSS